MSLGRVRSALSGRPLTGNGVIFLTALYGLVGWAQTAYTMHVLYPFELGRGPPTGTDVGFREVGPWIEIVTQYTDPLLYVWALLTVTLLVTFALFAERGSVVSLVGLVWGVGATVAFGLTVYGVETRSLWLVWFSWLALFAVGYLATGRIVERGGVYLGAGLVSGLLALYGAYVVLSGTGTLVLTTEVAVEAQTALAGEVLLPFPYVYGVLGVLHVLPMAVDGLRGGRELTPRGVPRLRSTDEDDADGKIRA